MSINTLHRIAALLRFGMKPEVPVSAARGELWPLAGSSGDESQHELRYRHTNLRACTDSEGTPCSFPTQSVPS
jgi:hypothetical protein